jgi:hypothetical protein
LGQFELSFATHHNGTHRRGDGGKALTHIMDHDDDDAHDEDGVDVNRGGDTTVRFGEIASTGPDYDALGEGMAKGNIHIAGREEGDRFDLSAGSEATRDRQEALLLEFENRRRQRALAVTTDDREVRRQLREMGEPMTLFGEKEMERRDRLRKHLADMDAADGGELPVAEGAQVVEEVSVQAELFYTEGTAGLMRARSAIASYSLPRAAARLGLAKKRRADADVDEVGGLLRLLNTVCVNRSVYKPLCA